MYGVNGVHALKTVVAVYLHVHVRFYVQPHMEGDHAHHQLRQNRVTPKDVQLIVSCVHGTPGVHVPKSVMEVSSFATEQSRHPLQMGANLVHLTLVRTENVIHKVVQLTVLLVHGETGAIARQNAERELKLVNDLLYDLPKMEAPYVGLLSQKRNLVMRDPVPKLWNVKCLLGVRGVRVVKIIRNINQTVSVMMVTTVNITQWMTVEINVVLIVIFQAITFNPNMVAMVRHVVQVKELELVAYIGNPIRVELVRFFLAPLFRKQVHVNWDHVQ